MNNSTPDNKRQQIEKIIDLLKQFPPEQVDLLLEQWMWELDQQWHSDGLPGNILQQIDEMRKQDDGAEENFINNDKDQ